MTPTCFLALSARALRAVLALPLLLAAAACERGEAPEAAAPEVQVAAVAQREVTVTTEWVGTTTGNINAQIYPKVQGYLTRQAYENGGVVKQGDLLFEIDPRQFQAALDEAKGQLARAQAALGKSEIDVKRYTPLAAQGAVSQQELDDAIQARAAGRAQVDSAKAAVENARLNLEWTQVRSPIDGVAAIATAQVGDLVSPATRLTSVSQLDPIKVTMPISEAEYMRFASRAGESEASRRKRQERGLELILAGGIVYPERGTVSVAGLAVDQTTGTIDVQGIFPNPDNLLRPGQYAKLRAVTDILPNALVIPQRAVRDLQGVSQVAVVAADDKVAFRNVKLGPATGSDTVVLEGVAAGERVVVEGLQKIRDGMTVKPVPAGATPPAPSSPKAEPEAAK